MMKFDWMRFIELVFLHIHTKIEDLRTISQKQCNKVKKALPRCIVFHLVLKKRTHQFEWNDRYNFFRKVQSKIKEIENQDEYNVWCKNNPCLEVKVCLRIIRILVYNVLFCKECSEVYWKSLSVIRSKISILSIWVLNGQICMYFTINQN